MKKKKSCKSQLKMNCVFGDANCEIRCAGVA